MSINLSRLFHVSTITFVGRGNCLEDNFKIQEHVSVMELGIFHFTFWLAFNRAKSRPKWSEFRFFFLGQKWQKRNKNRRNIRYMTVVYSKNTWSVVREAYIAKELIVRHCRSAVFVSAHVLCQRSGSKTCSDSRPLAYWTTSLASPKSFFRSVLVLMPLPLSISTPGYFRHHLWNARGGGEGAIPPGWRLLYLSHY